jgi:predicted nucleotidyltransferase
MKQLNEFGLSEDAYEWILRGLRVFPEIEEVIIFGSRAKGNYKPGSDIDLAVKGHFPSYIYIERIRNMLENGLPLLYFFDVVDYYNMTNMLLKEHIDRVGKIFYKPGITENKQTLKSSE